MLVNSKQIFKDAIKNHYALGAFNFVNLEILKSILESAEELNSPVIVQCSTSAIKYIGNDYLKGFVTSVLSKTKVPVILNLDHGKTIEDCKNAIDIGFTNVMIDASSYDYEQNIAITKEVVEYAHKHNVTVEAELGVLAGVEDDVKSDTHSYTDPDQAVDFIKKTGCDSLAIAIGTSHGIYKFKGEAKLRLDILDKLSKMLPDYPFVLHGASSIPSEYVALANKYGANLQNAKGVPEDMLKQACQKNICKVNVDSDLRIGFLAGVRESLTNNPQNVDMREYLKNGMKYVKQLVSFKIENVFNSKDKA